MSGDSDSVHVYEVNYTSYIVFTCMILTCRQLDSDIGAVTLACSSPGEMESIATPPNERNNEVGVSTEGFDKVISYVQHL